MTQTEPAPWACTNQSLLPELWSVNQSENAPWDVDQLEPAPRAVEQSEPAPWAVDQSEPAPWAVNQTEPAPQAVNREAILVDWFMPFLSKSI